MSNNRMQKYNLKACLQIDSDPSRYAEKKELQTCYTSCYLYLAILVCLRNNMLIRNVSVLRSNVKGRYV